MQLERYELLVRCADPIVHSQESLGNESIFMRKKMVAPNGSVITVPYITGNAIRNRFRRAATYGTLREAGILDDPQLSEGALRLLFSGGKVTGKGDASVINIGRYRELVALFPPLALFGGCTDNRPLDGQINVDEATLVCRETEHMLSPFARAWLEETSYELQSQRALVESVQHVAMDPTQRKETAGLLSDLGRANVEARQLAAATAHEEGDAKLARENKSGMMPYTFERVIQGAVFALGFEVRIYSPMDRDVFAFSMKHLLANFRVGGKGNVGHGRLEYIKGARVDYEVGRISVSSDDQTVATEAGAMYRAHVQAKKEELASWLRTAINS
jgi:CRISPR type IV-associated protein Csf2